ncbi:MAG: hypothetical protein ACP5IC_01085 [Minisyncoccia bacterium]
MQSLDKIAKILRADKDFILKIDKRLSAVTGKVGILDKIIEENQQIIQNHLKELDLENVAAAKDVYDALISKIESDDYKIFNFLGSPSTAKREDCIKVVSYLTKITDGKTGFFLKKEKAIEFLKQIPPQKILNYLHYNSVDEMLAKEDLLEIYAALRFIEGSDWLNNVFFKQYEKLTPDDFESRELTVKVLSEKWNNAAQTFIQKKWHNISHLKELGVVFIIPATIGISGELLRMVSLILHYINEIDFYSSIFKNIAESKTLFSFNVISLLRGDVYEEMFPDGQRSFWLVVQRYLAKDDENDWRLFYPHINPEALHWLKATENLVSLDNELSFWKDLDWVGDYFKDEIGDDILVSFNLIDTVMSLVKEKELIKYLYHHQEALWNKIFMEYFSREELENFSKEYLLQGYFEI